MTCPRSAGGDAGAKFVLPGHRARRHPIGPALVWLLSWSVLTAGTASAQDVPAAGTRVRIGNVMWPHGQFAVGQLVRISTDSVIVHPDTNPLGTNVSVPLKFVHRAFRSEGVHAHPARGGLFGLVGGAVLSGAIAGAIGTKETCSIVGYGGTPQNPVPIRVCTSASVPKRVAVAGAIGGAAGGALGLLIGSLWRSERWVPVAIPGMRLTMRPDPAPGVSIALSW